MTAISSARHLKFLAELKQRVPGLEKDGQEGLKPAVEALHLTYQQYQYHVSALRQLIQEYELMHRKVRVALRKQLVRQKQ